MTKVPKSFYYYYEHYCESAFTMLFEIYKHPQLKQCLYKTQQHTYAETKQSIT
ncbi:hypothetical protein [Sporosarcina sp. P37]|uniref:hypothetical protein n=1 Tax=Sporosarcina sp. P37 TaxID=1930546 RepID=UPI001E3DAE04|nr:hypothetical protein [Sporosarcina sp. P37]